MALGAEQCDQRQSLLSSLGRGQPEGRLEGVPFLRS